MNTPYHAKKKSGKILPLLLLAVICLLVAIYFSIDFFIPQQEKPIQIDKQSKQIIIDQNERVTSFGEQDHNENTQQRLDDTQSFISSLIPQQLLKPSSVSPETCASITSGMEEFYQHLDSQKKTAESSNLSMKQYLQNKAEIIWRNPPIVVRETDNLMNILQNAAHFFRILGEKDVDLLRSLLNKEEDKLEEAMALFYSWSLIEPHCESLQNAIHLPLSGMYEYASFFINTLGGQSYLYRRSHNLRTLVKYYVVLILHRANEDMANRHGIDIRPPLLSALADLEIDRGLMFQNLYIENLHKILLDYPGM